MEKELTLMEDEEDVPGGQICTDAVFERLAELIVSGEILLDSVVNEAEWAEHLLMSRGPVRNGVRRLQDRRLVTREPYLKAAVAKLLANNLVDIFELREALEGMACRLATKRLYGETLRAIFDQLNLDNRDDPVRFDFHVTVTNGSGNARIIEALFEDLCYLLRLHRRHSGSALGYSDEAAHEHWQIVKAMMRRGSNQAEPLMRSHIGRASANLTSKLGALEFYDA